LGDLLQPAERAWRLGQRLLALGGLGAGFQIGAGQMAQQAADLVECGAVLGHVIRPRWQRPRTVL
jgi:hypothetical protein